MATIEQKRSELEDIRTVRFISNALLEISATRMQKLREALEVNSRYYREISNVYTTVKRSAVQRQDMPSESPSQKIRAVAVAFTSNKRFYGTINRDVIKRFFERIREQHVDCIVIGTTGREIAEYVRDDTHCQYYSFEKDEPTVEEMQTFLKRVDPYERVFLYYPKFTTVFQQDVAALDITHASPAVGEDQFQEVDYIFEPELPSILSFFERQVRFSLFRRVMLETELARIAARFVSMNSIGRHSEDSLKRLSRDVTILENAAANRQLLESLSSFAQWKK
ncbi:MAG TPA: FoF1 ATP synthase subunit gamma [Candidatus Paceibacterota bacterium]|jgi:ATP synthase F1 gamma subunit